MNLSQSALVVEPNDDVVLPYRFLENSFLVRRVRKIEVGIQYFKKNSVDILLLSASFSSEETLEMLEVVKNLSTQGLIPLVIVLDWTNPVNFVAGTTWTGKIGVLDSFANEDQFKAVVDRIMGLVL